MRSRSYGRARRAVTLGSETPEPALVLAWSMRHVSIMQHTLLCIQEMRVNPLDGVRAFSVVNRLCSRGSINGWASV